jgi:hypothetical protein
VSSSSLDIAAVYDIPLSEVSGLGQRTRRGGPQLLAVGDADFTVMLTDMGAGPPRFEPADLRELVEDEAATDDSEWEAADGDGTGRIFVLQENPSAVFVLAPELDEVVATIDLDLEPPKELEAEWDPAPNSQAEGLVLLENGHVLVAKEKDPAVLIEFGPPSEDARGVRPELLFSNRAAFPLPDDRRPTFRVLRVWRLDPQANRRIDDISDVAVGPDDRLYILSDESRCVARVEPDLAPEQERLSITEVWDLPEKLRQPEGLVIKDDLTPIVAIDRPEREQNLFLLSSLAR